MKKLLAITPTFFLLAACATNAPTTTTPTAQVHNFSCEDNGQIMATYSADGQSAALNVTLPKVGLNNQKITLNQAVSGSGARYTNTTNPTVSYDWHTKADYGVMTIASANGQEYSVNCEL